MKSAETIRTVVLAAVAIVIVTVTLVRADAQVIAQPELMLRYGNAAHQDREKIAVQCEGLDHEPSEFGITVVGATGPSDALYFDALSYMSAEDFVALAESYSVHIDETLDSAGTDYRSTFGANVAGNIREQCAILRERQQTGVIVAHGQGLLLLALAGLAALITTPRQRAAARATSAE